MNLKYGAYVVRALLNIRHIQNGKLDNVDNPGYTILVTGVLALRCLSSLRRRAFSIYEGASRDLAGLVRSLFGGAEGMGTYSTQNNFDVWRAFVVNDLGVIPEPSDNVYNSPIEVQIAYRVEEVS